MTSPDPSPLRVLVVGIDGGARDQAAAALIEAGHEVLTAGDAEGALRLAATLPNAIVVDDQLCDLSGGDVCRRLKTLPATALIPVLQLAPASAATEANASGFAATADGWLEHPLDPQKLVIAVEALAARERLSQIEELTDSPSRMLDGMG